MPIDSGLPNADAFTFGVWGENSAGKLSGFVGSAGVSAIEVGRIKFRVSLLSTSLDFAGEVDLALRDDAYFFILCALVSALAISIADMSVLRVEELVNSDCLIVECSSGGRTG